MAAIQKRLRAYQFGLVGIVAFLGEARIRERAVGQVDFFVEGPEASKNDAAIVVGPETVQTQVSAAYTVFKALEAYRFKSVLAALDIKTATAKCDNQRGTCFTFSVQPGQRRACEALIVVSPKEPDFVLLIPMHYLPEVNKYDITEIPAARPLWTLHPLPAFPAQYVVFATPVAQLGRRLEDMRAYSNGSSNAWGNEYTGAPFTGVPPPRRSPGSVMEPSQHQARSALQRLRRYFTAFHRHSTQFRFDLVGVRPFLGDFKILDLVNHEEVFVELKDGLVDVSWDRQSSSWVLRHPAVNPDSRRGIFTWKAQWDYLLTADVAQRYAYFLPQDKIPADWWDQGGIREMWGGFQEYRVDLTQPVSTAQDMEKILRRAREETGSIIRRTVRPVRPLMDEDLDEHLGGDNAEPVGRQRWSTTGVRRGFGSPQQGELRGPTYAQWASEVLIELCRASGEGVILDFGTRNTNCRFAIALYRWSDLDKVRYDQSGEPPARVWNLSSNTPVVPLTLVGSAWTGDWQPRPGRNLVTAVSEFKSRAGSLVILDLYPENCLRMRHDRFVFASEQARPEPKRTVRGIVRQGLLDRFVASSGDLIKVITAPLRGDLEVTLGGHGGTIQARHYCYLIRELHQA